MGTYVPDTYITGYMNSKGCSVEEAFASIHGDPNNKNNTGLPDNDYIEEALDLQFKKHRDMYKTRNLRFYKLLGQNYQVLVSAIARGNNFYYKVPSRYELTGKTPFILDWLLLYGRPSEISKVRSVGPVKLMCIFNALEKWCEQNPSEAKNWVYQKEWEDYFEVKKDDDRNLTKIKKAINKVDRYEDCRIQKTNSNLDRYEDYRLKKNAENKAKEELKVDSPKPMNIKAILPKLEFKTKKASYVSSSDCSGDVRITIKCNTASSRQTNNRIRFSFRRGCVFKITKDYIVYAILNNRIYFKAASSEEGFKVDSSRRPNEKDKPDNQRTCYLVFGTNNDDDVKTFEKFAEKELELKYDNAYELYYVEVEEE